MKTPKVILPLLLLTLATTAGGPVAWALGEMERPEGMPPAERRKQVILDEQAAIRTLMDIEQDEMQTLQKSRAGDPKAKQAAVEERRNNLDMLQEMSRANDRRLRCMGCPRGRGPGPKGMNRPRDRRPEPRDMDRPGDWNSSDMQSGSWRGRDKGPRGRGMGPMPPKDLRQVIVDKQAEINMLERMTNEDNRMLKDASRAEGQSPKTMKRNEKRKQATIQMLQDSLQADIQMLQEIDQAQTRRLEQGKQMTKKWQERLNGLG